MGNSNVKNKDDKNNNKLIIKNEEFYDIEDITNEIECEFGFKRKEFKENIDELFVKK
jgi:hypothetical protein